MNFLKFQFIYESLLHVRNVAGHFLSGRLSQCDPYIRQTRRVAQRRREVKNYIFRYHLHPQGYVLRTCLVPLSWSVLLTAKSVYYRDICPSVCPHVTPRLPRHEFSWNLVSGDSLFRKSVQKTQNSLKSDKSDDYFTRRRTYTWNT